MATKEQVTEYLDNQFTHGGNNAFVKYWEEPPVEGHTVTRYGLMTTWLSPEISKILVKLVGPAIMVKDIARNGSNE